MHKDINNPNNEATAAIINPYAMTQFTSISVTVFIKVIVVVVYEGNVNSKPAPAAKRAIENIVAFLKYMTERAASKADR